MEPYSTRYHTHILSQKKKIGVFPLTRPTPIICVDAAIFIEFPNKIPTDCPYLSSVILKNTDKLGKTCFLLSFFFLDVLNIIIYGLPVNIVDS